MLPKPKKEPKSPAWALNRCESGKLRSGINRIELTDSEVLLVSESAGTARIPLSGAVARVETSALTGRRRLTHLHVEHPLGPVIRLEVWKREADEARRIAEVLNAAAQALADAGAGSDAPPERVEVIRNRRESVEQLARLAELHAQGALTDAEFAEAKARIISRL